MYSIASEAFNLWPSAVSMELMVAMPSGYHPPSMMRGRKLTPVARHAERLDTSFHLIPTRRAWAGEVGALFRQGQVLHRRNN